MDHSENVCRKCKTMLPRNTLNCPNCNCTFPSAISRKRAMYFVLGLMFFWVLFDDEPANVRVNSTTLFSKDSKELILENPELFKNESCYRIVGNIKNTGKNPWRHISVRANFYDEKQRLVDTNHFNTTTTLNPSEATPFKIVFGCCEKKCDMRLYQSYTLSIESANDSRLCRY